MAPTGAIKIICAGAIKIICACALNNMKHDGTNWCHQDYVYNLIVPSGKIKIIIHTKI